MTRWLVRAAAAVVLMGTGAALHAVYAQPAATFPGTFRHIGFVVKDADAAAAAFTRAFGVTAPPVRSLTGIDAWPDGFTGDRRAGVRTTEIRANGVEMHVLQPLGGKSPWRDDLDRDGDGALQHVSFGVTDLAGAVAALQKLGGTVTAGNPASFFAYVRLPGLPFAIELEKTAR